MYGSRETESGITPRRKKDTALKILLSVFRNYTNPVGSNLSFEKYVISVPLLMVVLVWFSA